MNSSSHSKALAAIALTAVALVGAIVWAALSASSPAFLALLGAIFLVALAASAWLVLLGRSIGRISTVAARAAKGDMEARVVLLGDSGVVHELAMAVNRVLDINDAFLREATAAMEQVRQGRFLARHGERGLPGIYRVCAETIGAATTVMAERVDQNKRMAADFEARLKGVIDAVASAATELQATAETIAGTAETSSQRATAVAAASEQASTNVQTVAAAAEELSKSIAEISHQVQGSTSIANTAVDEARRTDGRVQALTETAQKIGEVVQLINDIASQTNLLALNATIEAARAGEAGKGFAVVASEVKSLATQTARATEDISAQVTAIQGATQEAVEAIRSIGSTIGRISEASTAIASAVEEQGAATQEIARNVQQAAAGTHEVSDNIAGVTTAAGETGAATTQMLSAAKELAGQAETLRRDVANFFEKAQAA